MKKESTDSFLTEDISPKLRQSVFDKVAPLLQENALRAKPPSFSWNLRYFFYGLGLTSFSFVFGYRMFLPPDLTPGDIAEVLDFEPDLFADISDEDFEVLADIGPIEDLD